MKISPARSAAFQILLKIETEKAFSSVLLPLAEEKLEAKDRALCHELTLGALRRQIYLDRVIEVLTGGKKLDTAVRIILRLGIYQLLFLDKIPAHAALNEAVNLTQKAKKSSAKSFVNAVLRRLTRENIALEYRDEVEKLSVETSHPRWLVEKWLHDFGPAETEKLLAANNRTPALSFRPTAKTSAAVEKSLARENIAGEGKFLRELADAGKIYFQDEGSQMVAEAIELAEGESFLDVCAAPGSKTTYVAGRTIKSGRQNTIVAGDLHFARVRSLLENCRRQGVDFVGVLQYDAEKALPFAEQSFDAALVDAPCTGTGTIRHHPEIRYFLDQKDFGPISDKQLKILENASKLIKRGGKLIYSTCSLEREENEAVSERFLAAHADFEKRRPKVPEQFLTAAGDARTFPQQGGADGFFIAVFEKK